MRQNPCNKSSLTYPEVKGLTQDRFHNLKNLTENDGRKRKVRVHKHYAMPKRKHKQGGVGTPNEENVTNRHIVRIQCTNLQCNEN